MGMEQHSSSAATRLTEQPFLGSTLLTSSGGWAKKRWPKHCPFHLPGWLTAATGLSHMRSNKYKRNSSIKQRPLVVTSRNVRTLQDTEVGARRCTTLIACKLARYNIDIAALSETRLPDEDSLVEMGTGDTFFWNGLPKVALHGVGFAVRTALLQSAHLSPIAIDERLMTLRLPLAKNRLATFVSVYSPSLDSSDDVKDRFYDTLYSILRRISQNDSHISGRLGPAEITTYGKVSLAT